MRRLRGAWMFMLAAASIAGTAGHPASSVAEEGARGGVYQSEGHRDPFLPLVRDGRIITPPQATGGDGRSTTSLPVLHGILWDAGGRSIAMIDDTELQVGGEARGYQVTEITKSTVSLARGGQIFVLRLEESGGATPTTTKQGGGDQP